MAPKHRKGRSFRKLWGALIVLGYAGALLWGSYVLLIDSYDLPPLPPAEQIQLPPFEATPPPKPVPVDKTPLPVRYRSCTEVAKKGKLPLLKGQPGYRKGLDKDGDGKACENYY